MMELETWTVVDSTIDFSKLEPVSTGNSLHIYEERYEVNGETYRLLYAIGDRDNKPQVEKLVKKEMKTYVVKSGTLDVEVKAENRKLAAMDAIRKNKPKSLGVLIGIRKKGEKSEKEVFMLTQKVLEDMGQPVLTAEEARAAEEIKKKYDKPLRLHYLELAKEIGPDMHYLTEEEFKDGKSGMVFVNEITGKLSFQKDGKKKE